MTAPRCRRISTCVAARRRNATQCTASGVNETFTSSRLVMRRVTVGGYTVLVRNHPLGLTQPPIHNGTGNEYRAKVLFGYRNVATFVGSASHWSCVTDPVVYPLTGSMTSDRVISASPTLIYGARHLLAGHWPHHSHARSLVTRQHHILTTKSYTPTVFIKFGASYPCPQPYLRPVDTGSV